MLTLTFGLVTCEQKGEIGGEEREGWRERGDEVGVKGPGIRSTLVSPARAASAVCDFRGGSRGLSTSREGTERARREDGG